MKVARILLLGTVAAAGACHRDSGDTPAPVPTPHVAIPAPVKKGPTAAELTQGMVEAVNQGKSQLPVLLKFDLSQRPAVGQSLNIDLAVMPQIDANGAAIQVAGGDGLTVATGANQIDLPPVQAGQVYRHTIQVSPTAAGVLLLNLSIALKHDEITESRAFSIPLIVER